MRFTAARRRDCRSSVRTVTIPSWPEPRTGDGGSSMCAMSVMETCGDWTLQATMRAPVKTIASTRADYIPNLSARRRRVAFHSTRSGEPQIWVADPDGGNALKLTSFAASGKPGFPAVVS